MQKIWENIGLHHKHTHTRKPPLFLVVRREKKKSSKMCNFIHFLLVLFQNICLLFEWDYIIQFVLYPLPHWVPWKILVSGHPPASPRLPHTGPFSLASRFHWGWAWVSWQEGTDQLLSLYWLSWGPQEWVSNRLTLHNVQKLASACWTVPNTAGNVCKRFCGFGRRVFTTSAFDGVMEGNNEFNTCEWTCVLSPGCGGHTQLHEI